jgi:hypothetical protein
MDYLTAGIRRRQSRQEMVGGFDIIGMGALSGAAKAGERDVSQSSSECW